VCVCINLESYTILKALQFLSQAEDEQVRLKILTAKDESSGVSTPNARHQSATNNHLGIRRILQNLYTN